MDINGRDRRFDAVHGRYRGFGWRSDTKWISRGLDVGPPSGGCLAVNDGAVLFKATPGGSRWPGDKVRTSHRATTYRSL